MLKKSSLKFFLLVLFLSSNLIANNLNDNDFDNADGVESFDHEEDEFNGVGGVTGGRQRTLPPSPVLERQDLEIEIGKLDKELKNLRMEEAKQRRIADNLYSFTGRARMPGFEWTAAFTSTQREAYEQANKEANRISEKEISPRLKRLEEVRNKLEELNKQHPKK